MWVREHKPRHILDPAVGRGVFVDALMDKRRSRVMPEIHICDVDAQMRREFTAARRGVSCRWRCADFITASFRVKYDAVIANPPYVRHHALQYDDALLAGFDRICGRRLSRMTNLYGLFLIKIWTLLAKGGRAAVITPAEWLNADFGRPIKAYFLEQNALEAIIHFDHAANVFEGALTTAAIILLRRGRQPHDPIRLQSVASVAALSSAAVDDGTEVAVTDLDPQAKWTPLFDDNKVIPAPGNPQSAIRNPQSAAPPTLADVARCTRGIATGANDYFTLRESDRRRWKIDLRDLVPCITKARQIGGDTLTRPDLQRLIDADQRIYLLRPRPRLSAAVKRYLDEGRRRDIDQRYLPSHRPVWYMPEHRRPAPILVSVFARGPFRFVLNQAAALNLTAYHAIYLPQPDQRRIRALFAYLSSPPAQRLLRQHRRIYADGLFKLEPRDVEALPIPNGLRRTCGPPAAQGRR
jgi:adenine-specific DNA-methyltransferase